MERSFCSIFTSFASKKLFGKMLIPTISKVLKRHISEQHLAAEVLSTKKKKQMLVLKDKIIKGKGKSHEVDWTAVQEAVLKEGGTVTKKNISAKIFNTCAELEDFDSGQSFLNYLRSQNVPMSLGIYLMYFKLCHCCKDHLTEKDRQELLNMYEIVVSKYNDLLIGFGAEEVIPGVALTDRWEEGLELLERAKESSTPGSIAYCALIESASYRAKFDIALKLIDERMHLSHIGPLPARALTCFIKSCAQHKEFVHFESLLHIMSKHAFLPGREFAETLIRLCASEQLPFTCVQTSITTNGICKNCSESLAKIEITKDQHLALRSALINDSLIDSNIFTKTNPTELKDFQNFISTAPPYNVVIDGLNAANMMSNRSRDNEKKAFLLATCVSHFLEKKQKILVLGRQHMKKWRGQHMDYIRSHCSTFFVDNLSSDDHFTLYAALSGDLGTCFVTRDFMRSQKFLLKTPELQKIFKLWQQAHQIVPIPYASKFNLQYPVKYMLFPHQSEHGAWHVSHVEGNISYAHNYDSFAASSLQNSNLSWLCLLPKNKTLC